MIIMLDGPEKSGKSTLRKMLVEEAEARKWHVVQAHMKRPQPVDHKAYIHLLILGCRTDTLVIFDRSWISELVYNKLLHRKDTDLTREMVQTFNHILGLVGVGYILTDNPENLENLRSADDLPVSAYDENNLYLAYAREYYFGIIPKGNFEAVVEDTFPILERCIPWMKDNVGHIRMLENLLKYI